MENTRSLFDAEANMHHLSHLVRDSMKPASPIKEYLSKICACTRYLHIDCWAKQLSLDKVQSEVIPLLKEATQAVLRVDTEQLKREHAIEYTKKIASNIECRITNIQKNYLKGKASAFCPDESFYKNPLDVSNTSIFSQSTLDDKVSSITFDTLSTSISSPPMLDFVVGFYSDEEKKKLQSFDCFSAINDLVKHGVRFCKEEFLVYTLFREQKNQPGFRTYNDLKNKLPSRIEAFQDYFDLSSGSVVSKFTERHDKDNVRTEEAGIGAALALASHLYGFTEADWERLRVSDRKDTDFQIASTGRKFIQVEAKGTIVNSADKTQNIYTHKADIVAKKDAQRDDENNTNTLLGIITAFPSTNTLPAKCWILDPPAYKIDFEPFKYKLLSRLHYYWRELSMVSRSHFLEILINRIHAIRSTKAYKSLDKLPLLNRRGKPHSIPVSLFKKRSCDINQTAFGEVIPLRSSRNKFYFYGFHINIVDIILNQDFNSILSMRFKPSALKDTVVTARIPYRLLRDTSYDIDVDEDKEESRIKMKMKGNLTLTSSGRVLGFLQPY